MGILSTATIRKHWMKGCDLPSQNEMKKMGWDTHRCKCYLNSGLVIAWWYDNKCVNVCSIYANPEPFSPVIRWDWVNKKHIYIYILLMPSRTAVNPWVALTLLICWFHFIVQLLKQSGCTLRYYFFVLISARSTLGCFTIAIATNCRYYRRNKYPC